MSLFFKRAVVVQAERWYPGTEVEAQHQIFETDHWWFILASGAALPISPGDWLVSNPDGHSGYFPCPDAVFRTLYEPVEDGDAEQ